MISTPTTFVVGAGASVPYGLTTGQDLLEDARKLKVSDDVWGFLNSLQDAESEKLSAFLAALRNSPAESIDEFLEGRDEFATIGTRLVAVLMAKALEAAPKKIKRKNGRIEGDWLTYLIRRMREGASNWQAFGNGNQVRFVTFNFDTFLEERFKSALLSIYGCTEDQAQTLVDHLDVIHVHGTLPDGPATLDRAWQMKASESINLTVHRVDANLLERAKNRLSEAKVVCFLGFGYNLTNLKRLSVPTSFNADGLRYGTALGLEAGEQGTVIRRLGPTARKIKLGTIGQDCLTFLRQVDVLRD